ncbi:hypothetical protein JW707_03040, partial [Candidatus Woesearchaeota archaeon]|nr:hypothetical protein [Candidatus Woesearchaeota archaeon]
SEMSLESALRIFTEQGVSDPQWAVDVIQKVESREQFRPFLKGTGSSAGQFVNHRITNLYKGDPEFAQRTLETAKSMFVGYALPDEIMEFYITQGGGEDIGIVTTLKVQRGEFGDLDFHEIKDELKDFRNAADEYLFNELRSYVVD